MPLPIEMTERGSKGRTESEKCFSGEDDAREDDKEFSSSQLQNTGKPSTPSKEQGLILFDHTPDCFFDDSSEVNKSESEGVEISGVCDSSCSVIHSLTTNYQSVEHEISDQVKTFSAEKTNKVSTTSDLKVKGKFGGGNYSYACESTELEPDLLRESGSQREYQSSGSPVHYPVWSIQSDNLAEKLKSRGKTIDMRESSEITSIRRIYITSKADTACEVMVCDYKVVEYVFEETYWEYFDRVFISKKSATLNSCTLAISIIREPAEVFAMIPVMKMACFRNYFIDHDDNVCQRISKFLCPVAEPEWFTCDKNIFRKKRLVGVWDETGQNILLNSCKKTQLKWTAHVGEPNVNQHFQAVKTNNRVHSGTGLIGCRYGHEKQNAKSSYAICMVFPIQTRVMQSKQKGLMSECNSIVNFLNNAKESQENSLENKRNEAVEMLFLWRSSECHAVVRQNKQTWSIVPPAFNNTCDKELSISVEDVLNHEMRKMHDEIERCNPISNVLMNELLHSEKVISNIQTFFTSDLSTALVAMLKHADVRALFGKCGQVSEPERMELGTMNCGRGYTIQDEKTFRNRLLVNPRQIWGIVKGIQTKGFGILLCLRFLVSEISVNRLLDISCEMKPVKSKGTMKAETRVEFQIESCAMLFQLECPVGGASRIGKQSQLPEHQFDLAVTGDKQRKFAKCDLYFSLLGLIQSICGYEHKDLSLPGRISEEKEGHLGLTALRFPFWTPDIQKKLVRETFSRCGDRLAQKCVEVDKKGEREVVTIIQDVQTIYGITKLPQLDEIFAHWRSGQRDKNSEVSLTADKSIHLEDDENDVKENKKFVFDRSLFFCTERAFDDTDHDYRFAELIHEFCGSEKSNLSPPDRQTKDITGRTSTFGGVRSRNFNAEDFSQAGFYLHHANVIECYSCSSQHAIDDITSAPIGAKWHNRGCQHLINIRSRKEDLKLVESDGKVSDEIADPPGQQSIYIPPGDNRKEAYRLSTFEHFPVTCPISRKSLAKSGFFFTGFYDRVKCFACARTVERWEEIDNPADLKWHKANCPLPRGEDCGNVPLPNIFQNLTPIVPGASSAAATSQSSNAPRVSRPGEEVLEQRNPDTGALVRRVRYPQDLPERIRQTGGTFEIGPNNEVIIRSGPAPASRNPSTIGNQATNQSRRQWRMANVVSADHKRFLTNLYLNRQLDRLASFARWPVGRPNIAPAYLAKSGFFYLGDLDRTQCFSCGGVLRNWKLEDDADAEHRAHFPQCRMVLGTETRNLKVDEYPESEEERERKYPCRFPSNAHMRSEQARVGTFDRRWPTQRTAATPAEIAQAGFFFLGERDRAKCWYCNGGLQNWEYDDVPWIEHAKWFPNCQFLLRVKGQHFVYRHLAVNPHLARPIIARQDGSPLENVGGPAQSGQTPEPRSQDVSPSETRRNRPEASPIIIDPQEEMRKRKERIQNIMKNSEIVKNILAMGFDDKIVAGLLEDRISAGNEANPNDIYGSSGELIDDVFKKEEELRNQASVVTTSIASLPSLSGPPSFAASSSVRSGIPGASLMPSFGAVPGSGKYNVSYFGDDDDDDDDDERMYQDMYGSMEGTSASTSVGGATAAKELSSAEDESIKEAMEKIKEERMCKICFANQADMVFVPCSHMCCCMECTQSITQCPVCRKRIERAIKTYLN